MTDAEEDYWYVRLTVFAFDTKEQAAKYQDALIDAFCAMPESAQYGSSCRHYHASEEIDWAAFRAIKAERDEMLSLLIEARAFVAERDELRAKIQQLRALIEKGDA